MKRTRFLVVLPLFIGLAPLALAQGTDARVRGTGRTGIDLMKTLDQHRDAIIDSVSQVNPGSFHEDVRAEPICTSISIYASRLEDGKVPISGVDDRSFPGGASAYLPGDPAASLMYALKVSRNYRDEPDCLPDTGPRKLPSVDDR